MSEPEHASREVSAPGPGVMVPIWQGRASLWQPREEKLLLVFPDISIIKLHCVGFADGHVCASSSFARQAGGKCPMLPSSSKSMGEAGKQEGLESGARC